MTIAFQSMTSKIVLTPINSRDVKIGAGLDEKKIKHKIIGKKVVFRVKNILEQNHNQYLVQGAKSQQQ